MAAEAWPLRERAAPLLAGLRDDTGESVQLYVRDGDARLCVASLESPHELRTMVALGARLPLTRGSAGTVLRGDVPAGEQWVESVEERAPGVASVSAGARVGGELVAISVSGPIERTTRTPGRRYGPLVAAAREAAHRLTETSRAARRETECSAPSSAGTNRRASAAQTAWSPATGNTSAPGMAAAIRRWRPGGTTLSSSVSTTAVGTSIDADPRPRVIASDGGPRLQQRARVASGDLVPDPLGQRSVHHARATAPDG